jgi:DNA-nicking Smr family endonuclease
MRNKRRQRHKAEQPVRASEPKPRDVATSFGSLLERAGLNRLEAEAAKQAKGTGSGARAPKPAKGAAAPRRETAAPGRVPPSSERKEAEGEPPLSPRELSLLHQAYAGTEPIRRPKQGRVERPLRRAATRPAAEPSEEAVARARLSDLVGGGVRFDVTWDEGFVQGLRSGGDRKWLSRLSAAGFAPEAQLDLHGLRRAEVERAVSQFVRGRHRSGARYLLIIPGKGQHSEAGIGVLGEALAQALSRGSAAPLVLAFATAHTRHGGRGAVAVMLK